MVVNAISTIQKTFISLQPAVMPNKIKHLLVIRTSAMGDVSIAAPILLAFRKAYPTVKITLLTNTFFSPIFEQISDLTVKSFETKGKHKGILGIRKLAQELKLMNVDAVADLHGVLRTHLLKNLLLFNNIPFVQIDKGRAEKKALTKWENKIFKPLKTSHQRYADVFEKLGFKLSHDVSSFLLKKEKITTKTQDLIGLDTKKWIGIAPFAQHKGKIYSLEKLTSVIEELNHSDNYKIVLFGGGKNEIELLSEIENKFNNVLSVAGKLSFKEELKLISNLDVMVSMDSGNGHLAAMYGIPVITIWGVTHPYTGFAPYNQPFSNSLIPNLDRFPKIPTSVYGNKFPEAYEQAINSISPEIILKKIIEVTD